MRLLFAKQKKEYYEQHRHDPIHLEVRSSLATKGFDQKEATVGP